MLSCCFLSATQIYAQEQESNVIDKVIAVVGKNMVKESDLEIAYLQSKMQNNLPSENKHTSKCEFLETMLLNKLLLHEAEIDTTITFTDVEVEKNFENIVRMNYGSIENCEKAMGKSFREIKEQQLPLHKERMMIQSVVEKLSTDNKLTPKEVTDFFHSIPQDSLPVINEEYEFTQIVKLPLISQEDKEIIYQRLNDYRERALKGTAFATLAKLYSEDPGTAKKGGELGFFSRGQMLEEFETAAFALEKPGDISPVIETKYGFHIIQLIERRGNQVNCRHILIQAKPSDIALAKAKTELDSVRALIESGKISFEEAIGTFSDDESKINEGLIINSYNGSAKFSKENINEIMKNVNKVDFLSMKQGNITQPVLFEAESGNAYRLIKVRHKTEAHKVNLHDDYDKIYNLASEAKRTEDLVKWAEKHVGKTYVRLDNDYINCNFKINWTKNKFDSKD
jgi:peptidyl-prolyl cis-trans isomerase SurA